MPDEKQVLIPADNLDENRDIYGQSIGVGTRVRTHDFALGYKDGQKPLGYDESGDRACWMEGIVTDTRTVMEGCKRYTIDVDTRCVLGKTEKYEDTVYPPLNGTPSTMGGITAGVVNIEADNAR